MRNSPPRRSPVVYRSIAAIRYTAGRRGHPGLADILSAAVSILAICSGFMITGRWNGSRRAKRKEFGTKQSGSLRRRCRQNLRTTRWR